MLIYCGYFSRSVIIKTQFISALSDVQSNASFVPTLIKKIPFGAYNLNHVANSSAIIMQLGIQ
jgi:hypothetical protein